MLVELGAGAVAGPSCTPSARHARRKALDVINSLGLSDSVLRVIERRQFRDQVIVYGGIALVTIVVLYLLWRKLVA